MSRSFDEAMRKRQEAPEDDSPSKPCVTCGNDGKEYFRVDGKPTRICFKCWSKTDDAKKPSRAVKRKQPTPQAIELERKRQEFREESETALKEERATAKEENMRVEAGKLELVRAVQDIEGIQFLTQIVATNAASVKPQPQHWLWLDKVPMGAITWFVGKPGNAKSLSVTDLVARVSSGADFPNAKNELGPRKVLMYAGEDDLSRTVVPRLMAAGANLENIILLDNKSFRLFNDEYERIERREINLAADVPILIQLIKNNPDIALLVCDPVTGIWGDKNTNADKEMRPVLSDVRDMCEERNLTFVGVAHTNKRSDAGAIDQIQGASSFAGMARAAWLFARDPDSDDKHAHVMTCIKSNLSDKHDGLRLLTRAFEVPDAGSHPAVIWGEATETSADETLQASREKRERKDGKLGIAKDMILGLLTEGPVMSFKIYDKLEAAGMALETCKKAAKELVSEQQIVRKQKNDKWWMMLALHLPDFLAEDAGLHLQQESVMADTEVL